MIIRKLIERGIVKTVKSAKKIVDRKEPVVYDILEHVMKGHPVLLNRAPTLHRLGIQSFQPKLIEGKAIQLHPLACTAFNADFDGDQMAVHLPLGNEAILEAQLLMLASHNILNPANGAPITVPSQDMVLGLYYITKIRPGAMGEGMTFYGEEEAIIAYNEKKVALHALIKVVVDDIDENGDPIRKMHETTVGRVMANEAIPKEVGFINELLSKKSLRDIIGKVIKTCGVARTAQYLDDIKDLGYTMAFKGGLSFNLEDVIIPKEKEKLIQDGYAEVEQIMENYNMGFITYNERYNQIIDTWTHINSKLSNILMKQLAEDDQGFNSVYMMLDSGARGSREQIRQLSGMRGLMAKPQKSGAEGAQIIENPILANFNTPREFALGYFHNYTDYLYPRGGTGQLPQALYAYAREHGALFDFNTAVTAIDPASHMVRDLNGTETRYRALIWAADLKSLYAQCSLEGLPTARRRVAGRRAAQLTASHSAESVYSLFVASSLPPSYFARISRGHFIHTPCLEGLGDIHRGALERLKAHFDRVSQEEFFDWLAAFTRRNSFEIAIPALRDASLAPDGKTGLVISVLFDGALCRLVEERGWYGEFKKRMNRLIIEALESSVYPGLAASVLFADSASPATLARRFGTADGSIVGWSLEETLPAASQLAQVFSAVRTPLPAVFQAGQWTYSPAGVPIAVLTGAIAARAAGRVARRGPTRAL